ncbi:MULTISPECIES: hybrid sensor histidine kinase/response regulator [Bacteroidales]|uniref:histidine kinase n=1 Tax=Bacteroides stercorirosoris TaxID=871324 RepID=A0A1M6I4D1_9BACE|nr:MULTISPECIES: hybrid sensor histidine kinase/response regulator [Bacteroidales]MCS3349394.1 hybrid sensor histidine kinase/response regulator [Parabacteroides distasonis]MDU7630233.1 hybrid sensor histidine kinase/response regulator [Parabacteroides sp.]SHJ29308.1 Signal transduction histidine kinase [Bacteroides stercorirosoris]
METGNISLQYKVLLGYMILVVAVCGMVSILLYERDRMRTIRSETAEIRRIWHDISTAHRHITELATDGESVIVWEDADFRDYHGKRLHTDSLLQTLKSSCGMFVLPGQIDSLCHLLEAKEEHLSHIMKAIAQLEEADSLLANRLPVVAREAVRIRTVTRRKTGVAGWLGGKKSVQVLEPSEGLRELNDRLVAMQEERNRRINAYADSLRRQNRTLNQKLHVLVTHLDGQAQAAFISREEKITEAGDFSFKLFVLVIVSASSLLFISFLIIRHDIRKEREGRAQLQRINRENEELLGMRKQIILTISHDIRGPLGNISNCVELASETREKKKREGYLENIRHSCRHILNLVNNLMDVYRINETRDTRNEIPFRLGSLLDNISEEYARKAAGQALLFERCHEIVNNITVRGDADKLEQILDNLLTNAIKFTPSGTVRFHTGYAEGRLHVEVGDTGIGMDRETLERVFRPFERAAQEINSEGFGLGLFITKGLVKVLDGNIDVESRPGKGTIFRLTFPLPETTEDPETEEFQVQSAMVLPKRVLVVDDDSILLRITEDMLGRHGVECTTCQSVKEAVLALDRLDYDLVLTDIQMPVTDGFGLLKLLRGSDIGNSRTIPVAVMTARGDGDSGVYARSGFCGCIHKPFSSKGLLAFLSSVMAGRAAGASPFDYSRLMESTDDRRHMFGLVMKESEKDLAELEGAMEGMDREAMRRTVHRMAPVWELLGAGDVLSDYRKILHDKAAGDETVRGHTLRVMEQIRTLMDEVNNELEKRDDGNEKDLTGRGG